MGVFTNAHYLYNKIKKTFIYMARKQFLINYHTSEVANMPSKENIELGEIAVRHASTKPELIIKLDNDEFGVFEDKIAASGRVHTLNTVLSGEIDNLSGRIDDINDTINNNQTALTETFATKTYAEEIGANAVASAKTYADEAEADAVASAKTYVDGQINIVNGNVEVVDGKVSGLTKTVTDFKAEVARDYATKQYADDAEADALASAKTYADGVKDAAIASAKTYVDGQITIVNGEVEKVAGDVSALSGAVGTLEEDLTDIINAKVASAYIYQGSCTYAELSSKEKVVGYVWNVTDANGNFPAGTNYAWDGTKWDALGGSIDLSVYALSADVNTQINGLKGNIDDIDAEVTDLSGVVKTLKSDVETNYATKQYADDAEAAAVESANAYADEAKNAAIASASAYTDTKVGAVNGRVDTVVADVTGLTKTVTDFKAEVANTYATKTYADEAEADAVETANAYTDAAKTAAIASASAYTDTQVGAVDGRVDTVVADLSGLTETVTDFKAEVARDYATKTYADNAEADALASAKTYADGVKDAAIASASAYTDTKVNGVIGRVESLESKATTWDAAIQTVAVNSNVTATKEGTKVTFDFSKMIIDGGTF